MELKGRAVDVSSGVGYTGVFHEYIFVSNNNVKAVIEDDTGAIHMEDLADVVFNPPSLPEPQIIYSPDDIKEIQLWLHPIGTYLMCLTYGGELKLASRDKMPHTKDTTWHTITPI